MSDDLRATIEEAMNAQSESVEAPVAHAEGAATEAPGQATQDGLGDGGESAPRNDEPTPARARDAAGKFTKTKAEQAQEAKEIANSPKSGLPGGAREKSDAAASASVAVAGNAEPPAPPPQDALKPPPSWTPAAREEWAKCPPAIQKEVNRVNHEVQRVMQESAEVRRHQQAFQQAVGPYEGLMRAHGAQDALQGVGSIVQTWAGLTMGAPQQKAQILGNLFKNSGLSIEALAAAIDGTPPPQGQHAPVDADAIAAQVRQQLMSEMGQRQSVQVRQRAAKEVQDFQGKAEFFEDVRDRMAALVSADERAGIERPLQDVYDEACWGHPETRAILRQRELAKSAPTAQAATERASAAGSSVRNQPASPVNGARAGDLRSDIMASISRLNGGR